MPDVETEAQAGERSRLGPLVEPTSALARAETVHQICQRGLEVVEQGARRAALVRARAHVHAARYRSGTFQLDERATIVLFTDGLVEQNSRPLGAGLAQLERVADGLRSCESTEELCDRLVEELVGESDAPDDVAVLALRRPAGHGAGGQAPSMGPRSA